MWWWNHSADLTRNGSVKRFGMITTNTIKQTFVRRVVEEKLKSQPSISLIFAIPDHPWVDSTDGAAVRIAMTAGQHDKSLGKLMSVIQEFSDSNETEDLVSHTITEIGAINSDLSIGTDLTSTKSLNSNKYLCSVGMKTIGSAFQVSRDNAIELGLGKDENLNNYLHPDLNGRDFVQSSRGIYVRDIFGVALDKLKL